jgi:hypothetical protein
VSCSAECSCWIGSGEYGRIQPASASSPSNHEPQPPAKPSGPWHVLRLCGRSLAGRG